VRPDGSARRWWNVRTPERYIARVDAGESPEAAGEDVDVDARRFEALTLALRTRDGVPVDAVEPGALGDVVDVGLADRIGDMVVLTTKGRLLANEVVIRLAR
jgi:oxygen-independent coproporphyrinogen-3 oxidase